MESPSCHDNWKPTSRKLVIFMTDLVHLEKDERCDLLMLYYFVKKGLVIAAREIPARSEQQAIEVAESLVSENQGGAACDSVEVWSRGRKIYWQSGLSHRRARKNPPLRTLSLN